MLWKGELYDSAELRLLLQRAQFSRAHPCVIRGVEAQDSLPEA